MPQPPTDPVRESLSDIRATNQTDHLLRTAKLQITSMTQMADQKASIMTGLSVVMLSIVFGYVQSNEPTATLAVFGAAVLAAAVTAVFAVMPSRKKPGTKVHFNPLFFGHIISMAEDDYVDYMAAIIQSESRSYEVLIRDIHQMSTVVTRKYKLVGLSYRILVTGFLVASLTLVVELILKR